MSDETVSLTLDYGRDGRFEARLLRKRLALWHQPPSPATNIQAAVVEALDSPLDFPGLEQCVTSDDTVAVAVEVDTPGAETIIAEVCGRLVRAGIAPERIQLLQPAVWRDAAGGDPRSGLSTELRDQISLLRHDPTDEQSCAYLASTASGERIYLSRNLVEADMIISIGPAEFDPVLGIRGTASSLYPGLSNIEAIRRAQGQGHDELGPDDPRTLRQLVDEVGWLSGLQFSITVVPGGRQSVGKILAGQTDSVLRQARAAMKDDWLIHSDERAELALLTVTADAAGHGWDQVAAAIDVGRRLVERNGRIVVLSQLAAPPGPALEILRSSRSPRDAQRPIQRASAPDLLAASRIAAAADWANVMLFSRLPVETVDELFLTPIESEKEVSRLLENEEITAVVESAQHACVISGV